MYMHVHKHYTAGKLNTDVSCAPWCGQFISFYRQVFVHIYMYNIISHYCKRNKEQAAVDVMSSMFSLFSTAYVGMHSEYENVNI